MKSSTITILLRSPWVRKALSCKPAYIHHAFVDLTQLEENVEKDQYITMDEFVTDVQKIFDNCRLYNGEHTNYGRCANRLETYFNERLQVWTNGDY